MISKKELSVKAIEVLESSGWTENRNVLQVIYPKDFVLPFYVQEILKNLYGLTVITLPREEDDRIPCFYGNLEFFPENALGENEEGTFKYYKEFLNMDFYPLGEISNGFFYIALNENKIYLLGDNIIKLGENFYEGLEMLLTGIKGKQLNEKTLEWEDY